MPITRAIGKSVPKEESNVVRRPRPETILAGLLFAGVFLYHWFKVWVFAVDIPFWDDWQMLEPADSASWLWSPHAEHRIVTTKLVISFLYHLNGWDIYFHQTLNFFIFGLVLVSLGWLIRLAVPTLPLWLLYVLLTFALSPRASEIHHWAISGHYHWALLFFFLCLGLLFAPGEKEQSNAKLALGVVCGILAIYSFGIALSGMTLVVFAYGLFKGARAKANPDARKREINQAAAVCLILVLALAAYKIGYQRPEGHVNFIFPTSLLFWEHFVTMFANGFGYRAALPGAFAISLALLLVIGAGAWLARGTFTPLQNPIGLGVSIFGILTAMAGITMGRATFGIDQAFSSRYTEVTMMLIPLLGAGLWLGFARWPRVRLGLVSAYVAFCAYGFFLSWPTINDYEWTYQVRRMEARHLSYCYATRQDCKVPDLSPTPITPETLDQARKAGYSFMRKLVLNQW